ncbi:MAG: DUF1349 domain-containing protein, partial [Candidatus Acidiferrum sp.]
MTSNRRTFLYQSLAVAGAAAATPGLAAKSPAVRVASDSDLANGMTWLNEPASWKKSDGQIAIRSRPKTDFWRKTFYGDITDNGHFFHLSASGDFV